MSQIGDAAFIVALGWHAFTLTHKGSSLGIVLMVEALGLVTALLIAGVLAERYSRKLLLIGSDLARAVIVRNFCIGFGITLWDTMVMRRVPQHTRGLLPAGLGIWAALSGRASPGRLIAASSGFCARSS